MQLGNYALKPAGLWYSINDEWKNWCSDNMPDWLDNTRTFELDVKVEDMLIINTVKDAIDFNEKYKMDIGSNIITAIDWKKVSEDYKGMEIPNYYELKYQVPLTGQPMWLYSWDVPSGCLFTTDIINECKEIK